MLRSRLGTTYNSEYPAPLRSAQIGSRWSPTSGTRGTLAVSVKNDTADNLLLKDRKRNDKMNSQPTKQHICKPLQPTRNQSLQKSCFLADAPHEIDTFVVI
jgi:hypothetical protein